MRGPGGGGGESVTIDKLPDGTFTVSENPGEPQPAASLDEALQMAASLLSDPATPDDQGVANGYAKGAPKKLPGKPSVGAVFGESM